jgi:hypothetical protein
MNSINPDNIIVHGLWIGNSLSKLELLTINSYINNGHIFYLWTYQPLTNKLPKEVDIKDANTIIPENKIFRYKYKNQFGHGKRSLGGFSDLFRYKLLYEYGGWWTDMDITCLKPLNFEQPYIFRTHHELKLVGNLMKCPKNSTLMKNCYEKATIEINEENKDWHKPIQILIDEVKIQHLEKYILELTNYDSWNLIRTFLIKNITIPNNWHAIHWINEEWRRNFINKEIFKPNSTYGILMNKYGLFSKEESMFTSFLYWLKLTYIVATIRQLPFFIIRYLKK